jgi:2'-5' RNA ligase
VSDRLFFALLPDDALRQELAGRVQELLGDYPCRAQRPDQWHVTLEFIGNVADERLHSLRAAARDARWNPAASEDLAFDRLEHWPRPEVLCLTASQVPAGLSALVVSLRAALAAHGFAPEHRPFRPHLTLARKARQPPAARPVVPLRWPVGDLALVRSTSDAAGSRYEPLARWNVSRALTPTLTRPGGRPLP